MNEKKVCFIWNCAESEYLEESMMYIDSLEIPENFSVEKLVVNMDNVACGYNKAMHKTDAKYKVYLYERCFVLNKKLIYDILDIFKNSAIGMIGVVGSKTIPTSGNWYESKNKIGKVLINNNIKIADEKYENSDSKYEEAKVIDGCMMITQYDIEWKDGIFHEKYFYDIAQCVEFMKKGYKIVIPKQNQYWCLINEFNVNFKKFDYERKKFLDKYSKDIYPLVSILIPAYNQVEYFEVALKSAINQTYKNIEIVICDDSTDDKIRNLIESKYVNKYKFIRYYNNGGPLGEKGRLNTNKCFNLSKGEYINYLFQDDIFMPGKIERMMNYYIEYKNISLVTSYRKLIDSKENFLDDRISNQKLVDKDTIFDGIEIGRSMIKSTINFIGEYTTVLFRKADIENNIGSLYGRNRISCVDRATWLSLLLKGNMAYIAKPLSYFRIHENQNSNDDYLICGGYLDLFYEITDCYKNNAFINKKDYMELLYIWINSIRKNKILEKASINKNISLQKEIESAISFVDKTL